MIERRASSTLASLKCSACVGGGWVWDPPSPLAPHHISSGARFDLQAAPAAFGRALAVAADRSQGAVLVHCAQGKDRTGVLAALLQHAAGDSEEEIASAYALSQELLGAEETKTRTPNAGGRRAQMNWSALRGSPREAAVGTLRWLRKEYGAIDNYLEQQAGCGEGWRRALLRSPTSNALL